MFKHRIQIVTSASGVDKNDCFRTHDQPHSIRSGLTLIEMLVVMSVSAVLLSMVGVWTFKLLQFSNHIRQKQDDMYGMNRLAADFRSDVRMANQISIVDQNEIALQYPGDQQITYRLLNDDFSSVIQVQQMIGDRIVRREEYRLSEYCLAVWELAEYPDWVSLVICRRSNIRFAAKGLDAINSPDANETQANDPPNWMETNSERIPADSGGLLAELDSIANMAEKTGLIELQVRVAPQRWKGWELLDEN